MHNVHVFPLYVTDPPMATGCDVFADVPPDEDLSEGDLLFDLCDEPHLPVYHLFMGPDIG